MRFLAALLVAMSVVSLDTSAVNGETIVSSRRHRSPDLSIVQHQHHQQHDMVALSDPSDPSTWTDASGVLSSVLQDDSTKIQGQRLFAFCRDFGPALGDDGMVLIKLTAQKGKETDFYWVPEIIDEKTCDPNKNIVREKSGFLTGCTAPVCWRSGLTDATTPFLGDAHIHFAQFDHHYSKQYPNGEDGQSTMEARLSLKDSCATGVNNFHYPPNPVTQTMAQAYNAWPFNEAKTCARAGVPDDAIAKRTATVTKWNHMFGN